MSPPKQIHGLDVPISVLDGGPRSSFSSGLVDNIAATIDAIVGHGGQIVQPVGADAPEISAWFRDPAGNVLGLYQERGSQTMPRHDCMLARC